MLLLFGELKVCVLGRDQAEDSCYHYQQSHYAFSCDNDRNIGFKFWLLSLIFSSGFCLIVVLFFDNFFFFFGKWMYLELLM